ncbi:MAG: hypothetical protein INQ03_08915 [Candidatus Heimdallarchaeota archaeon]|nr:hypothetical protein [Candidatus Heimdallarchaeota archaeon]
MDKLFKNSEKEVTESNPVMIPYGDSRYLLIKVGTETIQHFWNFVCLNRFFVCNPSSLEFYESMNKILIKN